MSTTIEPGSPFIVGANVLGVAPFRVTTGRGPRALRRPGTVAARWEHRAPPLELSALTLRFSVSRNEEYVELTAGDDHRAIDLGARAHHLVLLALARSRLADREAQAAPPHELRAEQSSFSEGWVYSDQLANQLAIEENHLNISVFRGRHQLAQAGIRDAARLVERRRLTRELRLGVARIEIATM